jgi:hypothetical protein
MSRSLRHSTRPSCRGHTLDEAEPLVKSGRFAGLFRFATGRRKPQAPRVRACIFILGATCDSYYGYGYRFYPALYPFLYPFYTRAWVSQYSYTRVRVCACARVRVCACARVRIACARIWASGGERNPPGQHRRAAPASP